MFWFVRYRIPYSVSSQEAYAKLTETLQSDPYTRIEVRGDATRLRLEHKLPALFHNAWNPIFQGKINDLVRGSEMVGYFRINWLVFALMVGFLGSYLIQLWETWRTAESVPGFIDGWKNTKLGWDVEFVGMVILINLIGWVAGLRYEFRMLSAIKTSARDA